MKEANIIKKFREKLPGHWTGIENSTTAGVPDYSVSRNGHICWIEFKRLYNRDIIVRPLQRNWMIREIKHNGRIVVAYWDEGPAIILGHDIAHGEHTAKGGKLHYTVDRFHAMRGWSVIDEYLFNN